MSLRSRRRSKARGPGERKGQSLPRRILNAAERWKADRDFFLPFEDPAFDQALDRVLEGVERRLGPRIFEFLGDLNFEASTKFEVLENSDGELLTHCSTLFVIPMVGPRSEMRDLVSAPERISALASSFRTAGLFHETSRCILLPHLVDPTGLVSMTPGRLRQLTRYLGFSTLGIANGELSDHDLASAAGDLLPVGPDEGSDSEIISRAIVGVRSYAWNNGLDVDDWPSDFLSSFDIDDDRSISQALDEWFRSTVGPLSDRGLSIEIPSYWPRAIGDCAYLHMTIQLSVSRLMQGIDPSVDVDVVHIHLDEDAVWVATGIKGSGVFGPVTIPNLMIVYDRDVFEARVSELGREVVVHDTQDSFNAMFGTRH